MNPNIRDSCKLHLVLVFVLRESAERQRGSSVLPTVVSPRNPMRHDLQLNLPTPVCTVCTRREYPVTGGRGRDPQTHLASCAHRSDHHNAFSVEVSTPCSTQDSSDLENESISSPRSHETPVCREGRASGLCVGPVVCLMRLGFGFLGGACSHKRPTSVPQASHKHPMHRNAESPNVDAVER